MPVRVRALLPAFLLVTACGDGATALPPPPDASELATRFEATATSVERGGDRERAATLRGAAALLRLTREVSVIEVAIDGARARWLGIGAQIVLPTRGCEPEPHECPAESVPLTVRMLFAWRGDRLEQRLAVLTDASGRAALSPPTFLPGGPVPGTQPTGFLMPHTVPTVAILADGAAERAWLGIFGGVTTALATRDGACGALPPGPALDAECRLATMRFGLDARAVAIAREPGSGRPAPGELRRIIVNDQRVAGVVLRVKSLEFGGPTGVPGAFPLLPSRP